jgi:hypothetical protein
MANKNTDNSNESMETEIETLFFDESGFIINEDVEIVGFIESEEER